jgi:hypothetical protein
MGLEWGPLSLVSTIEELLETKSSGSSLEIENTAVVGSNYADKRRSLGMVRSRTQTMEFLLRVIFSIQLFISQMHWGMFTIILCWIFAA